MPRNIRNPDGTVNIDALNQEVNFLKGKYAQNAENIKRNMELQQQHEQQQQQQQQPHASSHGQPEQQGTTGDLLPPKAAPPPNKS